MTRAVVVLQETGQAELVDVNTGEVITAGSIGEMQVRADRVNEIHERHARIHEIMSKSDGNLTWDGAPAVDAANDRIKAA
jgi:hypothetical protein